jgi:cathepsin L
LEGYHFAQYVRDFKKIYGSTEYSRREAIFNGNLNRIRQFNSEPHLYKKGVNRFTDMSADERMRINGRIRGAGAPLLQHSSFKRSLKAPPPSLDYRTRFPPILTAVKDQGMCGSCWAHGAVESIETHAAIASGNLFVLSQQQVTSCAPNPNHCGGTGGCGGSTAELAYQYVNQSGGIAQEWTYPYTSYFGDTGVCNVNRTLRPAVVQVTGYTTVAPNIQDDVINALATAGPLAVNVDASSWFEYESGIFDGCDYSKNITIDHVVQLIGYGSDTTLNKDYWLIRNSWSASYGESGYIRILKTNEAQCGWDVFPQQGTGCAGGPPQVWACGMCGVLYDTSYPLIN